MGSKPFVDQLEVIKQQSLQNHQIEAVQITDTVMAKIDASPSNKAVRRFQPARRISVYASVLLVVLLASATVYGANSIIQIRNQAGEVKIQSGISDTGTVMIPYTDENAPVQPTDRDRVLAMIKPGQLLAYYARDGSSEPTMQFVHDTRIHTSYADFEQLLSRTAAPMIKEPTSLPAGFAFLYGGVFPLLPHDQDERTSAEYGRLLELFRQKAAAEPEQDLFVEEAQWSEANISELEYEKGYMNLRITAWKNMIRSESTLPAEYSQNTLNVGGMEVIFASANIHGFTRYHAIWYDETQLTHYEVTVSGDADMTEEQFMLIVEDLV